MNSAPIEPVDSKQPSVRVLLVDDDPQQITVVEEALDSQAPGEFRVDSTTCLADAIERIGDYPYDLVLLDLALPDADELEGILALQRIASDVPIVVLSGRDDEEIAVRAIQAGAQDYLVKGQARARELSRTLRYARERHRLRAELVEIKQRHIQPTNLATHDALTGLPNRHLFYDRLSHALSHAERYDQWIAVLCVDLDRFKHVNDTLGHAVGDELLRQVAARLKGSLRKSDTVSRLGGDELVVILHNITRAEDAGKVARKLLGDLAEPFFLDGHELFVTASAGIAVYPGDGANADSLLKNAETALYKAKAQGQNHYEYYAADMNSRALDRLAIESGLRRAIERDEFVVYYQPQVDLRTGIIVGAEALVRWQHPKWGLVAPGKFIPIAEETGLIDPIGEWVLKAALAQNRRWQDSGHAPIRVAVNVSSRQFRKTDLPERVAACLRDTNMDATHLELEITESCMMEDTKQSIELLRRLKGLGVRIAIDDFGTGYSSLNVLKHVPTDSLKIDRSFVRNITTDNADATIATTIIAMARSMNFEPLAEGVETNEQLDFLRTRRCELMQGFLVSRPVPASEFEALFGNGRNLLPARV